MIDRQRFKDWEFYLVEVEARWKKVKETTLFWPDASTAILMDYDIPDLFKRLRELEAENRHLKAVAEAAKEVYQELREQVFKEPCEVDRMLKLEAALAVLEEAKD